MNIELIKAKKKDLERIVEIYNWAIKNTTATFDTEEKSVANRTKWFDEHNDDFPLIIAEDDEGLILGWGSLTRWSDRKAYDVTAEVSFYISPEAHGKGIGSIILQELIKLGENNGKRCLISRVTKESQVSLHLHKKYGFEEMGVMKNCGVKFGRLLDVHFLQYIY